MSIFSVGDHVQINDDVDFEDFDDDWRASWRRVSDKSGVIEDSDNFGIPNNPTTLYSVRIEGFEELVPVYAEEMTLIKAVS